MVTVHLDVGKCLHMTVGAEHEVEGCPAWQDPFSRLGRCRLVYGFKVGDLTVALYYDLR